MDACIFFIIFGTVNENYINFDVFMLFCGFDFVFVQTVLLLTLTSLCIFLLACKEGYFGTNCSRKCSPNCKSDKCRHTDGWCICDAGLNGGNCTPGKFCRIFIIF